MHLPPPKDFITTKQGSKLSGYSSDYLARLARAGDITGRLVGRAWLIEVASLEAYLLTQGDRNTDGALARAQARKEEYRAAHSSRQLALAHTAMVLPAAPSARRALPHALALALALAVVGGGAFVAQTTMLERLASEASMLARASSIGFHEMLVNVLPRIASRFEHVRSDVAVSQSRVARELAYANTDASTPLAALSSIASLVRADLARLAHTLATRDTRMASVSPSPHLLRVAPAMLTATSSPELQDTLRHEAIALLHAIESPETLLAAWAQSASILPTAWLATARRAHQAVGMSVYGAIVHGLDEYPVLLNAAGARALTLGGVSRDIAAEAPEVLLRADIALGRAVVAGTRAAVGAEISLAYGTATAAPATARFVILSGYAAAERIAALGGALTSRYLAFIESTGRAMYAGVSGARALATWAQGASTWLASDTLAAISNLRNALVAVPTLAGVADGASYTYHAISDLFGSAGRYLAGLFGRGEAPTLAVIPLPAPTAPASLPAGRLTPAPYVSKAQTTYLSPSYITYATNLVGVSKALLDQSLVALRLEFAGIADRSISTSPIRELPRLTVTGGVSIAAGIGTFTELTGGLTSLATTTITSALAVSGTTSLSSLTTSGDASVVGTLTAGTLAVGGISSGGVVTVPSFIATSTATSTIAGGLYASLLSAPYFHATSTSATSTFGAALTVGAGQGNSTFGGALSINGTSGTTTIASGQGFTIGTSQFVLQQGSGNVGVGTTSPTWLLNPSSATASQLALSSGAGFSQWAFRNAGGLLYISTTTVAGTATSTTAALTIDANGRLGIGSTTPGTFLSIGNTNGINLALTSTSTIATGFGLNVTGGCYAVNSTCLSLANGGIAGTLPVSQGGTGATSLGKLQLLATDSSGNVTSTSTPTASVFNATSTTATSTFAGGFVAGLCVTEDTLLRIRRRKRRGDSSDEDDENEEEDPYQYLTIPIVEVESGDEVLSLDPETGRFVYRRIKGLLDTGMNEVFKLRTASGRYIETTARHPYLVRMKKGAAPRSSATPRVRVAIDYANLKSWLVYKRLSINLDLLRQALVAAGATDTRFYYGTDERNVAAGSFFAALRRFGYVVVTKPVSYFKVSLLAILGRERNRRWLEACDDRVRADLMREAVRLDAAGIELLEPKANFDVEIASDALGSLDEFDVFVLFSGDGDFAPLAERLREQGKRVITIAGRKMFSGSLKNASDVSLSMETFIAEMLPDLVYTRPKPADERRVLKKGLVSVRGQKRLSTLLCGPVDNSARCAPHATGDGWRREWRPVADLAVGQEIAVMAPRASITDYGKEASQWQELEFEQITAIESTGEKRTYDIEVEGTHNFVAGHLINTKTGQPLTSEEETRVLRENGNDVANMTFNNWLIPEEFTSAEDSIIFGGIVAHNTAFVVNQGAPANSLYIAPSGNVGIGTTTPGTPLAVTGAGTFTGLVTAPYFTATSTLTASTFPYASTTALTASGTGYFGLGQFTQTSGTTTIASGQGFTIGTSQFVLQQGSGNVGVGTTSPTWLLNPSSATASQLALSSGAGFSQWAFRNAGGLFYLATTTVAGTATSTTAALAINPNGGLTVGALGSGAVSATGGLLSAGTLSVANGGTGATNLGTLQLLATDSSGNVISTSTPTAAAFFATSTSAASTFPYASSTALTVSGHCVTADTRLRRRRKNAKGEYEYDEPEIIDIEEGDEIQSLDEKTGEMVWSRVKKLMFMGVKQTYRITTEDGRTIRTTAEHPYLVDRPKKRTIKHASPIKDAAWVKVSDIRAGQYIAAPLLRDSASARKPALGVFIDGSNLFYSERRAGWGVDYERLRELLSAEFDLQFINYYTAMPKEGDEPARQQKQNYLSKIRKHVRVIVKPLKYLATRIVTEGLTIEGVDHKGDCDVEITVDIMNALSGLDAVIVFSGDSDFVALRKDVLKKGKKICFIAHRHNLAFELKQGKHVPLNMLRPFIEYTGGETKTPATRGGTSVPPSIVTLLGLSSATDGDKTTWLKVTSIEPVTEEDVYDIEVEGTHNFIGNGIVAHNTYLGTASATGVFTSTATAANTFPYASTTALTVSGNAYLPGSGIWNSSGNVGIGTTTPQWMLTASNATKPQLALTDTTGSSNAWTFRNIANTLYIATSSYSATSTTAALAINPNGAATFGNNLTIGGSLTVNGLCMTGDTRLLARRRRQRRRSDGTVEEYFDDPKHIQIKDIRDGDLVLSFNEKTGRMEWQSVLALYDMGEKPIYRLTTESGKTIRTTGTHPYLTPRGWVRVAGLVAGDAIAAPKSDVLARYASASGVSPSHSRNESGSAMMSLPRKRRAVGYAASTRLSEAITTWLRGGSILMRMIPKNLRGLNLRMFAKSESCVMMTRFSRNSISPISSSGVALAGHVTSYPSPLRYLATAPAIFSSQSNLRDIFARLQKAANVMQSRLNMLAGELRVVVGPDNFFDRHPGLQEFKNQVHHDAGAFEGWLAVADARIGDDVVADVHNAHSIAQEAKLKNLELGTWNLASYDSSHGRLPAELRKVANLAGINGTGIGNIQDYSHISEIGDVRSDEPIAQGSDVSTAQHRGRKWAWKEGIRALFDDGLHVNQRSSNRTEVGNGPQLSRKFGASGPAQQISYADATNSGVENKKSQSKFQVLSSKIRGMFMPREDIAFERIVSIEYEGIEQVWDISVAHTHNFVAAGLLAHNTAIFNQASTTMLTNSGNTWLTNGSLNNALLSTDATGKVVATSTPTAAYFIATSTTVASTFPYASSTALTVSGTAYFPGSGIWNSSGNVGVGTTTPTWLLNPSSATASQLALSSGAGFSQWAFRNAGGNLYFATTTVAGTATSSVAALTINANGGLTVGALGSGAVSATGGLLSSGTLSVANGGTGTTTAPISQLLYGGTGGIYQSVATSSLAVGTGLTTSGTLGAQIGGANASISFAAIAANSLWANNTGASAVPTAIATSSLFAAGTPGNVLTYTSAGTWVPLATTTFSTGLAYANGAVTCTTATAAVFGCLAAADWSIFNNKVSSTSLTQIFPFTTTSYGVSTSTIVGFTGGLMSMASSTFTSDVRFPGSGIWNSSGNVGIGTSSPTSILEIGDSNVGSVLANITNSNTGTGAYAELNLRNDYGTGTGMRLLAMGTGWTTSGIFVQDAGVIAADTALSGGLSIGTRASAPMRFYTANTEAARIDTSGNFLLGTTTTIAFGVPMYYSSNGGMFLNSVTQNTGLEIFTINGVYAEIQSTNAASAVVASIPLILNRRGGSVGIGTSTPGAFLHVLGTTEQLRLGYDSTNYASFTVASDGKLTIAPSGNNTTIAYASSTALTVSGTGFFGLGAFTNTSGTTTIASGQGFTIGSSQFVLQQGSGNVGIGNSAPNALLHVGTDIVNELGVLVANQQTALGTSLNDNQPVATFAAGNTNNDFKNTLYVVRDTAAGTTWTTTRWHDAINVDSSFLTPGTDTKVWWERDPNDNIQSWGNAASTYMTINAGNVGIGSTTPFGKLSYRTAAATNEGYFGLANGANVITNRIISQAGSGGTGLDVYDQNASNSAIFPFTVSNNTGAGNSRAVIFAVTGNGNVGIGSTTPATTLSVAGSGYLTGGLGVGILNTTAGTIDTGQGANELYDMDQNVLTTSDITFNSLVLTTDLSVANGGTGASTLTGLLQGNGASAITGITGTAGQFPYYNGASTLLATSTLFLSTASNVGIGTTTPRAKLSVVSGSGTDGIFPSGTWAGEVYNTTDSSTSHGLVVANRYQSNDSTAFTVGGLFDNANGFDTWFTVKGQGNVGIGNTAPRALFDVLSGTANTTEDAISTALITGADVSPVGGTGNLFLQTNDNFAADKGGSIAFGGRHSTSNTAGAFFAGIKGAKENSTSGSLGGYLAFYTRGASTPWTIAEMMRITSTGNVGIGTTTPGAQLSLDGAAAGGLLVRGSFANLNGLFNASSYNTLGLDTTSSDVRVISNSTAPINFYPAKSLSVTFTTDGKVGIGTTTPNGVLTVFTSGDTPVPAASQNGSIQIVDNQGTIDSNGGLEFLSSPSGAGFGSRILSPATGAPNGLLFQTRNNSATWSDRMLIDSSTGNVGIGTTTPISTLSVQGSLCVRDTGSCGTTAGTIYATTAAITDIDLAENYATNDASLAAGEIVAFDPASPTYIIRASESGHFLGVVSTAPGVLLGKEIANAKPIALAGRVPVKVNMDGGAIAVGDAITISSSTPGVGAKAITSTQTIGIALESASAPGTIEVFIKPEYTFAPGQFSISPATGYVGIGTNTPTHALQVAGEVGATSFVVTNATPALAGTSTMIEMPAATLTAAGEVDLYKLATFNLLGMQALATRVDGQELRLTALEERLAALEAGNISIAPSSSGGFSGSTLASALSSFGIIIEKNLAQFVRVVSDNLQVGSSTRPTGITMFDKATGDPYCFQIEHGVATYTPGECALVGDAAPTDEPPTISFQPPTEDTGITTSPTEPPVATTTDPAPETSEPVPEVSAPVPDEPPAVEPAPPAVDPALTDTTPIAP